MDDLIVSKNELPKIRDAIVAALEVSAQASSKATHYHTARQQRDAVVDHISKLHVVGKELPLIVASIPGAQGFYVQEAILQELGAGTLRGYNTIVPSKIWDDEGLRNNALYACFRNLDESAGITYVLRMLVEAKERKINNARTRRFALEYIWGHPNLEFIAVKYRSKLRKILTHVYGVKLARHLHAIARSLSDSDTIPVASDFKLWNNMVFRYASKNSPLLAMQVEIIYRYIFGETRVAGLDADTHFDLNILAQVYRATTDITGCVIVPEEVIIGLLSNKLHPQHTDKWSTKEKQNITLQEIRSKTKVETANQAVRKTVQEKKRGINREVPTDVSNVTDPIALLKTIYELQASGVGDIRENEESWKIYNQVQELAIKARYDDFPYKRIGVVVDSSYSMSGHYQESKNTPRASAAFLNFVLGYSSETMATDTIGKSIARAFLDVLRSFEVDGNKPDAMFVLSDGYDNDYDGLLSEVVAAWQSTGDATPVFHISPIGSAEVNAKARSLGSNIASFAANYRTLPLVITANLLETDPKVWLKNQVERLALVDGVRS